MTVKLYRTLGGARACFQEVVSPTAYQSYAVLQATERSNLRRFIYSLLRRPWTCCSQSGRIAVVVVSDDRGRSILAIPLEFSGDCAYVAGHLCKLDYIDVLYGDVTDERCRSAYLVALEDLRRRGYKSLVFSRLQSGSRTDVLLSELGGGRELVSQGVCIHMGDDYESYFAALSKHARQNVRTAYNRLTRDAHGWQLQIFTGASGDTSLISAEGLRIIKECDDMYLRRSARRYDKSGVRCRLLHKYYDHILLAAHSPESMLCVFYIDDQIAAFMMGYVNVNRCSYEIPRLAINDEFAWYSPGLLLINETIKSFFKSSSIRLIDLCDGTEKYKFDMGGVPYDILLRSIPTGRI